MTAATDLRRVGLETWLREGMGGLPPGFPAAPRLQPITGDASFRRYFRVPGASTSWIAVDAPPEQEDSRRFVNIARAWHARGVPVPRVHAWNEAEGFMLLEDLGDRLLYDCLDETSADALYGRALEELVRIQGCQEPALPAYDAGRLRAEMQLFFDWLLGALLNLGDPRELARALEPVTDCLVASALEQPRVRVHRDYHSRNLLVANEGRLGIIDFQDAVLGPLTYDPVSLLRDCYLAWPPALVRRLALKHADLAVAAGLVPEVDAATYLRWFDLMGVQRHLKAAGIFARLWVRDAKPGYLADIPRTLAYVAAVAHQYPQLAPLESLLKERLVPELSRQPCFSAEILHAWFPASWLPGLEAGR